jgi:hypothetical protein
MTPELSIPPYSPRLFVGREDEIKRVGETIHLLLDKEATSNIRTIVYRGERGSGKTWLALHIKRNLMAHTKGVDSLFINFYPAADKYRGQEIAQEGEWFAVDLPSKKDPALLCTELLRWIAEQMKFDFLPNTPLQNLGDSIMSGFEEYLQNKAFVLILDSIFEANWEFLEKFETHFLGRLAALPGVLIIMTGRGRLYPWVSPYLRVDAEEYPLAPFNVEQIRRQTSGSTHEAEVIKHLGGGYPLSNIILAQIQETSQALDVVAQTLLSVAPPEQQGVLRRNFEALCLLDGFRDDEIPVMLAAYTQDPNLKWEIARIREEREKMVATHLVHWRDGKFVIDESIRRVLENYLEIKPEGKELWRRLHCQAFHLYTQWAERYQKSGAYFTDKANWHKQKLEKEHFRVQDCTFTIKVAK